MTAHDDTLRVAFRASERAAQLARSLRHWRALAIALALADCAYLAWRCRP